MILLVEDNPDDVFLLRYAFERAGVKTPLQVVGDGQEAIDYLSGAGEFADRAKHPLPSLMLLDLNLPRVKGLEVLRWVREQPSLRTLVVIVLTSSQMSDDVRWAYELGANSFVVKPMGTPERLALAQGINQWWLGLNCFAPVRQPELTVRPRRASSRDRSS